MDRIGGLWLKTSKKGTKFFSGSITLDDVKTSILVFKNNKKEKENSPDYQIFLPDKREKPQRDEENIPDDDVPF